MKAIWPQLLRKEGAGGWAGRRWVLVWVCGTGARPIPSVDGLKRLTVHCRLPSMPWGESKRRILEEQERQRIGYLLPAFFAHTLPLDEFPGGRPRCSFPMLVLLAALLSLTCPRCCLLCLWSA